MSWYESSKPRSVKGGIKPASAQFGKTWWATRWIAALERFDIGSRLARGRTYARAGQVISIEIQAGKVTAKVQGSRARPYKIEIAIAPLTEAQWQIAIEALSGQAYYAAKLMAGEMPETIEDAFTEAGLSLFPKSHKEIHTSCSCPDWSNPCKHVAAVYYIIGSEFDRDPFLIFKLRGADRDTIIKAIVGIAPAEEVEPDPDPEPISKDPARFWQMQNTIETETPLPAIPKVHAALPKRLGSLPFWRSSTPLTDHLESIYKQASYETERFIEAPGGE